MEDEILANSLLIRIEGGIVEHYTYEDIIDEFRDLKDRRVEF
jgi:hypothetical protein